MDCERIPDTLFEEPDASPDGAPANLRTHLLGCAQCRRIHESLQRGRTLLRSLPPVPVTENFFESLQSRIHAIEERGLRRRRRARVAGRFALAGAAAVASFLVLSDTLDRRDEAPRALASTEAAEGTMLPSSSSSLARPFAGLAAVEAFDARGLFSLPAEEQRRLMPLTWRDTGREAGVVLVATPSLSFAAPPAAFRFVSASSSSR